MEDISEGRHLCLLAAAAQLNPLHFYRSFRALRGQLNPESVDRFQTHYRSLYAVIGISMPCFVFYQ